MGMSYDLYWDGDPDAVKPFREADKIRQKRANTEAWIQGMYVYDAVARVAPLFRTNFSRKSIRPKAEPYPEEPYDIFGEKKREEERRRAQEDAEQKVTQGRDYFLSMARRYNRDRKKGGAKDGAGNRRGRAANQDTGGHE